MPLIQWIMQNLNKTNVVVGSGGIIIYGDSAIDARYTEYLYAKSVKFNIGSTGFDIFGHPWTVTGIHVASNGEITYFAKSGKTRSSFKDSSIFVNQQEQLRCNAKLNCLENKIKNLQNK